MSSLPTIHIIGAGIGGLTLARSLRNKSIHAIVFEKNPSPARHSYGISLQPRAYQALLEVLKIDESTLRQRVAVDCLNGGQDLVNTERLDAFSPSLRPLRAHRGRLEGLLRESVDVKWGHVLGTVSVNGSGTVLSFKEKEDVESAFVVDSSGVHSSLRSALLPKSRLNILPYVVFRGTRHIEGSTFKEIYEPSFKNGPVVESKKDETLLQIAVNDQSKNRDRIDISYIYSRPAHPDDQLHQPGRQLNQATDISEIFFEEVSKLPELEQPFKDAFDEKKMRGDRMLHWLMRDILISMDDLTSLAEKGIVLMGDSAHATPILGGEGANSAILDAIELADVIADQGPKGIEKFYKVRYGDWDDDMRKGEKSLESMHSVSRSSL